MTMENYWWYIRRFFWQIGRAIRRNWIWFKCDECGVVRTGERVKVNALYGDVWCVQCYEMYIGIEPDMDFYLFQGNDVDP